MRETIATIHPHKPTTQRPTQQWVAYDGSGAALGYAHNLEKLTAYLIEQGYTIVHETCTHKN
jgi:hypothetical protein